MSTTKKKFKLFDMNRDGKGVDPGEDTTPNLKFFFKQLARKFSKIISLNILMIFQVIPILISVYFYIFASPTTPTQYYPEYAALFGIQQATSTATGAVNMGIFSFQLGLPTYNTYVYWVIGALMLFLVLTYGWQKVGSIYVMRGLVRGDSVFVFSDYFYAIKRNFKQGFVLGIIDCLIMFVLGYDLLYFFNSAPTGFSNFIYVMTLALIVLYIIFRFYTYLMIVTFNIKLTKAFKNALIFIVLGIKRNIMALLGLVLVTALAVVPIFLLLPLGLGVALVLPLIYYLGVSAFIYTYAAYPVIKKHMIDPVVVPAIPNNEEELE
ncbi:MAG: DUF624 domain-containing protein [Clostridia bacterium]|nr:DUF624 domain-containing protein [Clostridia bacterium]MBR4031923.1 DUF624 domain-containing protein [Clostridia bacterium]